MEGIDQNPVFYEAVLDGLWTEYSAKPAQGVPVPSTTQYLKDWGAQRCGKRLPQVEQAWEILANTTFRSGQGVGLGHRYCSNFFPPANWDSSVEAEGAFWRGGYKTDAEAGVYTAQLFDAWKLLTESADECGTAAARFDVAGLGREWLQSVPCIAAWRDLASGWKKRSPPDVEAAATALQRSLLDMDELLSTADGFTLGAWIAAARNLSATAAGKAQLEMNARAQVTTWTLCQPGASRECPAGFFSSIMDYAIKQWGGLMREYQFKRLRLFTRQVVFDLTANASTVDDAKFKADYYREQMAWLRTEWNETALPPHGVGNVVALSRAIQQRYEAVGEIHNTV
jgi:alpha-N-acetylglucosaminidase